MEESLKKKTFRGTLWTTFESFSVQGILFVVMIIMARILTPADYGLIGMISIFIAVSNSLINSGFAQALTRRQNRTEVDICTVFIFNNIIGISLYILLFFTAPLIADFYKEPQLVLITRVISITLVLNSISLVQRTLLSIKLDFKTQAMASFISSIISGSVGITLAYTGFGVWALILQQIVSSTVTSILIWVMAKWHPSLLFSWKSLKEMFGFGAKLQASSLINTVYNNIYGIVIGKLFKAADLGYYSRANSFSDFGSSNLTGIFQRVSYPVLCTIQNDDSRLQDVYRRILRTSTFVVFPVMVGLASLSYPFILTILTPKWEFAAFLLVPICFAQMWYPVHSINLNLLQVKGRSDLFLKLEIIKKIIGIAILCGTAPFGLYVMCWGMVASSLICLIINTHYTGKLLNLGLKVQLKDLFPILLLSLIMGAGVYLTLYFISLPPVAKLFIGIIEGAIIYIGIAGLLRFPEFKEFISFFKK